MSKPFPYAVAWEKLQPLVSFRFNPEKQPRTEKGKERFRNEKAQVRAYWKTLVALQGSRQTFIYRPRNPANLGIAQRYAQMPKGQKRWRVAFIPGPPGSRVRVRNGVLTVTSQGVSRVIHYFSDFEHYKGERVRNPEAVADRILAADTESKWFRGICGESETTDEYSRDLLWKLISTLANPKIYADHREWFLGCVGYRFTKQVRYREYRKARANTAKIRARRKRALRRKGGKP
jgi:hypothetical protein